MSAMEERKRHISFGLPGRLSINGFSDYDSGVKLQQSQIVLLVFSSVSLAFIAALLIVSPAFWRDASALIRYVVTLAGLGSAFAAYRRPMRLACFLVIALWTSLILIYKPFGNG